MAWLIQWHKKLILNWGILLICLGSAACLAQSSETFTIPFFRINTMQGLSQSTVFCMYQDRQGFIWFGTAEGLNRYDGYNFKVYRHNLKDKKSISSNEIISLNEDDKGNIWVGTRTGGLSILNTKTQMFDNEIGQSQNFQLNEGGVYAVLNDHQGHMWVGTHTYGIVKISQNSLKVEKIQPRGRTESKISTGFVDKNNRVVFGNENFEVIIFENGKLKKVIKLPNPSGIQGGYISSFTQKNSQEYYVSTSTDGFFSLNADNYIVKNEYFNRNVVAGLNNIKKVLTNDQGHLLAATDNGMLVFPNKNLTKPIHIEANSTRRFGLSARALQCLFEDRNHNIWVGTWEGGLNVWYKKQPPFKLFRQETGERNGPLERKITGVAARNEEIWMATNSGLSKYNRQSGTWQHFGPERLGGKDVNVLKYDLQGNLFINTYQGNPTMVSAQNGQFKSLDFKSVRKTATASISSMAPESKGNMWIGTTVGGVYVCSRDNSKISSLGPLHPSPDIRGITSILEDSQKRLWLGTNITGLYQINLNTKALKHFTYSPNSAKSLSDNHILSLAQDKKGNIWIGTNGGGLCLFEEKTKTFKNYSTVDGLPNNTIKSIIIDQSGLLWLSTNLGICNFNPATSTVKTYTEADGLQGKEFGRNVGTITEKGEIFFGGTNGLSYFHPKDLKTPNSQIPKIIFTDFKLFNKSVDISKENAPIQEDISQTQAITLKNDQSVFTLEFAALDFQQLKNYQYAYKLEGFDKDWNEVGTTRNATYTNLREGTYTFKVRSTDNYGQWVKNETSIAIKILPPWYRSIWAYMLYLAMLALALYLWRRMILIRQKLLSEAKIQRIEAQKIRELDEAKTNFFTNISHEFRTPLTLIISPLQQLMQESKLNWKHEDIEKKHSLILKNAHRLLRLINQILDISKLESGNMKLEITKNDVVEFLNSIALAFGPMAKNKNIDYQIDVKCKLRYVYFDKDILEKITFNLLSNAFKYSNEGGSIKFTAHIEQNQLKLKVQDDGIGIGQEALGHIFDRYYQANGRKQRKTVGSGIGLALTKELIELHYGHIEVESKENEGSCFYVTLPINYESFDQILIKENFEFESQESLAQYELPIKANSDISLENDKEHLLIVEDNDELRDYLASLFEQQYKVECAKDGLEAIEKATLQVPDLIISDFMMPNMDGGQLCEAIKTNEKTSHIPFLMLTSKQAPQTMQSSFESGADDYILKPFNSTLLVKKVGNVLKSRKQLLLKIGTGQHVFNNIGLQPSPEQKFIERITHIVTENIDNPDFDITQLEQALAMSKMQLYRKTKAISNVAPNELIRSIRLRHAKQLLSDTDLNISEIAYAVGFNDPAYFTRAFKKEFGKAPSEFQKGQA